MGAAVFVGLKPSAQGGQAAAGKSVMRLSLWAGGNGGCPSWVQLCAFAKQTRLERPRGWSSDGGPDF